mmetsp:Transcript_60321/g.72509  ORF Transcript_60321/g.72509 Transcript_60321/m.72509 type:complete len:101 (+) Transcript_60321:516-818(+)
MSNADPRPDPPTAVPAHRILTYGSEPLHHVKRKDSSRSGHSRSKSSHTPQHKSPEISLHDMKHRSTHSLPSNLVSQQYMPSRSKSTRSFNPIPINSLSYK